jgi:hypothetical protein
MGLSNPGMNGTNDCVHATSSQTSAGRAEDQPPASLVKTEWIRPGVQSPYSVDMVALSDGEGVRAEDTTTATSVKGTASPLFSAIVSISRLPAKRKHTAGKPCPKSHKVAMTRAGDPPLARRLSRSSWVLNTPVAKNAPLPGETDGDEDEEDSADQESLLPKKRSRGRPATTGDGVGMGIPQGLERENKVLREALDNAAKIDANTLISNEKKVKMHRAALAQELNLLEEAPTADLSAGVMESITRILGVADKSGNLKGPFQKILREEALRIEKANLCLTGRALRNKVETELEMVRQEMATLREEYRREMATLREENRRLKEGLNIPSALAAPASATAAAAPPSSIIGTRERKERSARRAQQFPESSNSDPDVQMRHTFEDTIREIAREGAPPVMAPPLGGVSRMVEPAILPSMGDLPPPKGPSGDKAESKTESLKREISRLKDLNYVLSGTVDRYYKQIHGTMKDVPKPGAKATKGATSRKETPAPAPKAATRKEEKQPQKGGNKAPPPANVAPAHRYPLRSQRGTQGETGERTTVRNEGNTRPPPAVASTSSAAPPEEWTRVVGRKEKKVKAREKSGPARPPLLPHLRKARSRGRDNLLGGPLPSRRARGSPRGNAIPQNQPRSP